MQNRLFLLCCFVLFGTSEFFAQKKSVLDSVYVDSLLVDDLFQLKKVLFESHPHPGGYDDTTLINLAFDNALERVQGGMSYRGFAEVVQEFLQHLQDSHTNIDLVAIREYALRNKESLMPIQFSYNGQELWVKKDVAGLLENGFIIHSINGLSPQDLFNLTHCFSFTEGDAEESKIQVETAMISSALLLKGKLTEENEIVGYKPGSSELSTIRYSLLDKKEMQEISKKYKKTKAEKFAELFDIQYFPNDSLAILTISTFVPYYFQRSEKFIRSVFKNLNDEGYRHLVIDVRDNTGGSSARVEHLCSYLFDEGHNAPSNIIVRQSELAMKRSRRSFGGLKRLFVRLVKNENVKAFFEASSLPEGAVDTLYFSEPVVQKEKYVFKGKVYVFMNGLTASAGVDFASAIRQRNRGILIGQPCMGSGHGTWGNPENYRLKNSGIPLHIATIRYNSDDTFDMTPTPMQPDYLIKDIPRAKDDTAADPFVKFILDYIRK